MYRAFGYAHAALYRALTARAQRAARGRSSTSR